MWNRSTFPVVVGGEVAAVLEFFCPQVMEPDEQLLEVMAYVGTQLGCVVERTRAVDALQQSERRTRLILEMAYDAYVAIDADGTITDWNAQAVNTFGWTREEAIGRPLSETIVPTVHREAHRRGLERFVAMGEGTTVNRRVEMPALHRDGHTFPVELTITPIRTGDTYVFSSFLHDISKRKESEDALRKSEERLRLVSRATNDVIWEWDIPTGERVWNESTLKVFRYSADEVNPSIEWWCERIHPEDRERVISRLHAAISGTGDCWSDEYRFLRGDGSNATVLDRGYVLRNERGGPSRMIGSMMDVTERKRVEEDQRFLARASALLDTSLDYEATLASLARLTVPSKADYCLIDVVEPSGDVRRVGTAHVDPRKEHILSREKRQPAEADPEDHPILKVVRTGEPILVPACNDSVLEVIGHDTHRSRTLRKLGLCSFMIVPIVAHGRVLGAMTLATSESGRHYSPVDLMLAEDLARRAAVALENGRLYENAQRAIGARDEVLGVISHDLRNPLNTIKLSASLLHDVAQERRSENIKFLQIINRSADQMSRMIENLLDLSSIEGGRFSVAQSQRDVASLLTDVRGLLEPLTQQKSIRLTSNVAAELSTVWIDPDQILRVFSNLVGNAIKFTPEQGAVTLRAERMGAEVCFSVADTGPGIPPEQLPHVFDRYWQARKGDRRGVGLGLAIAKGIVEAHDGRIWVQSEMGKGTTFYFTVPLTPPGSVS
ncbi:MAG: PAS domain S-box protein [Gemmatimonadetes bacterium]|nr:PAS domain S-box protein [Gemmatimonadota bacterium]